MDKFNVPYLWLVTLDPRVPYLSVAKSTTSTTVRIAKMAPFWWLVPLEATMAVSHLEKKTLSWMISLISQIALFWGGWGCYTSRWNWYVCIFQQCWFVAFHVPLPLCGWYGSPNDSESQNMYQLCCHPCCTKGGCEFHSQLWSRHQHLGSFGCVLSG